MAKRVYTTCSCGQPTSSPSSTRCKPCGKTYAASRPKRVHVKRATCLTCGQEMTGGHKTHCLDCRRILQQDWRAANGARVAEYSRRRSLRRYGLTTQQYDAMLADQHGRCFVCQADQPGGMGRFPVDHNHRTRAIRKLLCNNCNAALGMAGDSADRLRALADYLDAHASDT